MKRTLTTMLLGGLAMAVQAVNVTVADPNPTGPVFAGGPYGYGQEDNEVDTGTAVQMMDLEAMSWAGGKLYLVGGFNFLTGAGGSAKPGDLFIRMSNPEPGWSPTVITPGSVPAGSIVPGYDYVVRLSDLPTQWGTAKTGSVGVHKLLASDSLATVTYDTALSNPWKLADWTRATDFSISATFYGGTFGLTSAQVAALTGDSSLASLHSDSSLFKHYVLEVDMAGAVASPAWLSYTMECGNDVIKGHVPDGGASIALLGLAMLGLGAMKRRFSR